MPLRCFDVCADCGCLCAVTPWQAACRDEMERIEATRRKREVRPSALCCSRAGSAHPSPLWSPCYIRVCAVVLTVPLRSWHRESCESCAPNLGEKLRSGTRRLSRRVRCCHLRCVASRRRSDADAGAEPSPARSWRRPCGSASSMAACHRVCCWLRAGYRGCGGGVPCRRGNHQCR